MRLWTVKRHLALSMPHRRNWLPLADLELRKMREEFCLLALTISLLACDPQQPSRLYDGLDLAVYISSGRQCTHICLSSSSSPFLALCRLFPLSSTSPHVTTLQS